MTLSPFEVERREFGRTAMGYKTREVDDFLDEVHRSLGKLWEERSTQREELERLKERLSRFEQIEEQLKNTLLLAQDSAEKAHEQARRESDLIMREAGQKARDIVHAAHEDKSRLEMVLRDLHSSEQEARQRMRALSQTVLSHLDDTEQLVQDGATTLRAIVQAQPDVTELRSAITGQHPRVEAPAVDDVHSDDSHDEASWDEHSVDAPVDDRDAHMVPTTRTHREDDALVSERAARLRNMATSTHADAFFDAPPTFDASHVAPLEAPMRGEGRRDRDRQKDAVEPRSFADF